MLNLTTARLYSMLLARDVLIEQLFRHVLGAEMGDLFATSVREIDQAFLNTEGNSED